LITQKNRPTTKGKLHENFITSFNFKTIQSITKVKEYFPYKSITTINGEPTYSSINKMTQDLYSNTAEVSTTLGGEKHGHIGLIMKSELYKVISTTTFQIPEDPGTIPIYPTT